MVKQLKKGSAQISASMPSDDEAPDFLPLEGGPGRKVPQSEIADNKASVLYIGRIPHGFYENEMEGFFKQFGAIKRLRIARNKKTGKSKHFGFIEIESPEVERCQPMVQAIGLGSSERRHHDKERTLAEHRKLVESIMKQDQKRRKRIEAAGIEYECPEILGSSQPGPKKMKFDEDRVLEFQVRIRSIVHFTLLTFGYEL